MPEIVRLLFSRRDDKAANVIAGRLGAAGFTVQAGLYAQSFDPAKQPRCFVALWSRNLRKLDGDLDTVARKRTLVNVSLDDVEVHVPVRSPIVDFSRWPDLVEADWDRLLYVVRGVISRTASPERTNAPVPNPKSALVHAKQPDERGQPELQSDADGRSRRLFVCYRREDSEDAAGRLHDRLTDAFGSERVFIDVDSVPLGIDFVDHVREQVARCSVVIVMIGRQWLTIKDNRDRRRLDNPDDLVRAEIAAALQQNIPVIPVLVQNAQMPLAENLPEDIKLLARRNGIHLRPEQWKESVNKLLRGLGPIMGNRSQ